MTTTLRGKHHGKAMIEHAGAPAPSNPPTRRRDPQPRPPRREVVGVVVRSVLAIGVASSFYALAPLGRRPDDAVVLQLVVWLLLLAVVIGEQVRAVTRSTYPGLRAAEAALISLCLLIFGFASMYFVLGRLDDANFTEPLSRIDAVYFTVTVLATVGFGDIAPRSQDARMLVTVQMLTDLVLIGFIAKILFGAAQQRRQVLSETPTPPDPGPR